MGVKDKYWASDYQAYNQSAPEKIREMIIE